MHRKLFLVSVVVVFIATTQPAFSAEDTTILENTTQGTAAGTVGGPAPKDRDGADSSSLLERTLSNLDKTLTASLIGSLAGLTLAAAGLLLTNVSSVEGRIQRNTEWASQAKSGDPSPGLQRQIEAEAREKEGPLVRQAGEARNAARFALRAFGWFIFGLLMALSFDPVVTSVAENLRSELLAVTDVAATGGPMLLGIVNLVRSAVTLMDIADPSPSDEIEAPDEHEELGEGANPERRIEAAPEHHRVEALSPARQTHGRLDAQSRQPGLIRRFFRLFK
jgi:hypothetical protein